jgi:RNA polymerase sigma factor (sigma-70 family)
MMDRDLVVRAREGDRDAFARLAAAAITRLDAIARMITRDPERAKDAVQEALTQAWRNLPSLRDPDRFDAWLRRLLVRACVDELRHARRRVLEVELTELDHPKVADSSLTLADRDALDRAFRRLDSVQRSLVVLYYYADLPLADVADALALPVGTAKSRLFRARETLRAALEADARDGVEIVAGQPA